MSCLHLMMLHGTRGELAESVEFADNAIDHR